MRHRVLLSVGLAACLAGCTRGCGASGPTLSVTSTTATSVVLTHPGPAGAPPWQATLEVAPGGAAPVLLPDPTEPGRWIARWTTPGGTHDLALRPDQDGFSWRGPASVGSFTPGSGTKLLLLSHGAVLERETTAGLKQVVWQGAVAGGEVTVIDVQFDEGGDHVVLWNGASLDGSWAASAARTGRRLSSLSVDSKALSFKVRWREDDATEVQSTATLEDGREVPLVLRRDSP